MRKRKISERILSFVLTLAMVLSLMPANVVLRAEEPGGHAPGLFFMDYDEENSEFESNNMSVEGSKFLPSKAHEVTLRGVTYYHEGVEQEIAADKLKLYPIVNEEPGDTPTTDATVRLNGNEVTLTFRKLTYDAYMLCYDEDGAGIWISIGMPSMGFYDEADNPFSLIGEEDISCTEEEKTFYLKTDFPSDMKDLTYGYWEGEGEARKFISYEQAEPKLDNPDFEGNVKIEREGLGLPDNTYQITLTDMEYGCAYDVGFSAQFETEQWNEEGETGFQVRDSGCFVSVTREEPSTGLFATNRIVWDDDDGAPTGLEDDAHVSARPIDTALPFTDLYVEYKVAANEDGTVQKAEDLALYVLDGTDEKEVKTLADGSAPIQAWTKACDYTADDAAAFCAKVLRITFPVTGEYRLYRKGHTEEIGITIRVDFPQVGFYSAPELDDNKYLNEITQRGNGGTVYLIAKDTVTLYGETAESDEIAVAEAVSAPELVSAITKKDFAEQTEGYKLYEVKLAKGIIFDESMCVYYTNGEDEDQSWIDIKYMPFGLAWTTDLWSEDDEDDPDRLPHIKEDSNVQSGTIKDTTIGIYCVAMFFYDEAGNRVTLSKDQVKLWKKTKDGSAYEAADNLIGRYVNKDEKIFEIQFDEWRDYKLVYTNDETDYELNISVSHPNAGFYRNESPTEDGYLVDSLMYNLERGCSAYLLFSDMVKEKGVSAVTMSASTEPDGKGEACTDYFTCEQVNAENKGAGYRVTLTENAKGVFYLIAEVKYGQDESWRAYLTFAPERPLGEDGMEHTGYAGCYLTEEEYKLGGFFEDAGDVTDPLYYVHADTMQGVVDKLYSIRETKVMCSDGYEHTIHNTGYMYVNTSYMPKYGEQAMQDQFVHTPEDVHGIIFSSGSDPFYARYGEKQSPYEIQGFVKKPGAETSLELQKRTDVDLAYLKKTLDPNVSSNGALLENDKNFEGVAFLCTIEGHHYFVQKNDGDENYPFKITEASRFTEAEEKIFEECYEGWGQSILQTEFRWPNLYVDATTSIKITGRWAEKQAEGAGEGETEKAGVYLTFYDDKTEVVSKIFDKPFSYASLGGKDEKDYTVKNEITYEDGEGNSEEDEYYGEEITVHCRKAVVAQTASGTAASEAKIEGSQEKLRNMLGVMEGEDTADIEDVVKGETVAIDLSVDAMQESAAPAAVSAIKAEAEKAAGQNKNVSLAFLDINLHYQVGTNTKKQVTETKNEINITMNLPQAVKTEQSASSAGAVLCLYRFHDGKTEKLTATFRDGKMIFDTDKFSVYAVAVEKEGAAQETPATPAPGTSDPGTTTDPGTAPTPTPTAVPVGTAVKPADAKQDGSFKVTDPGKADASGEVKDAEVSVGKPAQSKASVTIPATIKGENGIEYKVTSIESNAFKNDKKLTTLKVGSNIETIGKSAFQGCKKLKTVTLGSKMTSIGQNSFSGCVKLKKVSVPKSVTTIGKGAFSGCKALKTVTITSTKLKKIDKNAFKGLPKNATVQVPKAKKKAYTTMLRKAGFKGKIKVK